MQALLTEREVSDLLRVPLGTLRNWRRKDQGPRAIKAGKRVLYVPVDAEDWVDQQTGPRVAGPPPDDARAQEDELIRWHLLREAQAAAQYEAHYGWIGASRN